VGRPKLIQDAELLAVAREVFIEKGLTASTREIANRAGISEAVIYQRHPTKEDLFFAAMVPPALDVEELLATPADDLGVPEHLEQIALGMVAYFRKLFPILLPLMTHPSFQFEKFAQRHPDAPVGRLRRGLTEYLEAQRKLGRIGVDDVGPAAIVLFAAAHSVALFERLGVHGGDFDDSMIRAMVRALWTGLAPK